MNKYVEENGIVSYLEHISINICLMCRWKEFGGKVASKQNKNKTGLPGSREAWGQVLAPTK